MTEKNRERRKGFSLVEMLIVIALLGILTGGIALSIGLLRDTDTKGAAYDINSALTDLKSRTTGGKSQPYLYLYFLNQTCYVDIDYVEPADYTPTTDAKVIGDDELLISHGSGKVALGHAADDFLCIAYQKKDGAFLQDADGNCQKDGISTCPEMLYVEAEGASGYVVHMIPDTGHHYVEEE